MVAANPPHLAVSEKLRPWPALYYVCFVRFLTLLATLALSSLAVSAAGAEGEPDPDPDMGVARPEAEDLRGGHLLLSVSGGLWLPSSGLTSAYDGLGDLGTGAAVHGQIGLGLGRYVVVGLDGGFGWVPATSSQCQSCSASSIDGGASVTFHPTQGFAVDPWIGYGMAYRHTLLSHPDAGDPSFSAFDFMRLSLGADYFPLPSLGFGPYLGTDIGIRSFDAPTSYATFQLGMRMTWDPMRTGTSFTPGVASR